MSPEQKTVIFRRTGRYWSLSVFCGIYKIEGWFPNPQHLYGNQVNEAAIYKTNKQKLFPYQITVKSLS